jgi:GTPase-associated adaptor domain
LRDRISLFGCFTIPNDCPRIILFDALTGDNELKDYEVAVAAVRRAARRGQLGELDREIDAILTDEGR